MSVLACVLFFPEMKPVIHRISFVFYAFSFSLRAVIIPLLTGGLEGKRTLRLRIRAKYSTLLDYVYTHKEHFRHVWFKPALLELDFYKQSL